MKRWWILFIGLLFVAIWLSACGEETEQKIVLSKTSIVSPSECKLSLTVRAWPISVIGGEKVALTFQIKNLGEKSCSKTELLYTTYAQLSSPSPFYLQDIVDRVEGGKCTGRDPQHHTCHLNLGTLKPSEEREIKLRMSTPPVAADGRLGNLISLSVDETSVAGGSFSIWILARKQLPATDLAVKITDSRSIKPGRTQHTFQVENKGKGEALFVNAILGVHSPYGPELVVISQDQGWCKREGAFENSDIQSCYLGTIRPSHKVEITVEVAFDGHGSMIAIASATNEVADENNTARKRLP